MSESRTLDGQPVGCSECVIGDEDPRAWCDCIGDDPPCKPGPCRQRAHDYEACPVAKGIGVDWGEWQTWELRVSTIVGEGHCHICNHQFDHGGAPCSTHITREQADWVRRKRELEGIVEANEIRTQSGQVIAVIASKKLTAEQTEAAIDELVRSRFPYEVKAVLDTVLDSEDRAVVVGAALARTLAAGRAEGVESQKAKLRGILGL